MSPSHSESDNASVRLSQIPNPFTGSAVGSVWDSQGVDEPSIHSTVFEHLLDTVAASCAGVKDRCVILYGNAGSGKTHLMRRLRLRLQTPLGTGCKAAFSWIRMQTSPTMIWRHLRRQVVNDLCTEDFGGHRQIDELLIDKHSRIDSVKSRSLATVLEHLAHRRHQRDARAWLAGERLPDTALAVLGVPTDEGDEEAFEDECWRMVKELAEFFSPTPLVLCLDQLESLQSQPGDRAGLFAIGKMLADLNDQITNRVVIGCAQTGLIGELDRALPEYSKDRYRVESLPPLNIEQARAVVRVRLHTAPQIERLRPAGAPDLWPVDPDRLVQLVHPREGVTARKVLFECEQMFREAQGLTREVVSTDSFLDAEYAIRMTTAGKRLVGRPEESTEVLSDGIPRLLHLRNFHVHRDAKLRGVDHIASPPEGRPTMVVVANEPAKGGLWQKLERVEKSWDAGTHRLVVFRDALHPLSVTATKTRDRLRSLEQRGARVLSPSIEALAALDAMRGLLGDADSGDLAAGGDSLAPATVEDWIRRHMPDVLAQTLDGITGVAQPQTRNEAGGPGEVAADLPGAELLRDLIDCISEHKVAPIDELAGILGRAAKEIEVCVMANPDAFGLLGGDRKVVFEKIPFETGT
jgi:hypothetical protein